MTGPRQVLFATIAAGGGHVATANAMAEALALHHPGAFGSRVSDVMAEIGPAWLDRRHKASWKRMLARPRLVRNAQRLMDRAPRLTHAAHALLLDRFARAAAAAVNAEDPALVVVNHGWLATAFTAARRSYRLRAPVVVFETEPFDASALWYAPHVERVVAPSLAAKTALVRLGVAADRVDVVGYPVRQGFLRAPRQDEARRVLGLEPRFTALLSLGAEGVSSRALAQAKALALAGHQVIAVAGRNRELRQAFDDLARAFPSVQAIGFSDDMPTLLAASDVVVGKAGPASVMEALAVGRPVVVTGYAGLNEEAVVRFLRDRRLGSYAPDDGAMLAAVQAWSAEPDRRQAVARSAEALAFPAMARSVADYLAAFAHGGAEAARRVAPVGGLADVRAQTHAARASRTARTEARASVRAGSGESSGSTP